MAKKGRRHGRGRKSAWVKIGDALWITGTAEVVDGRRFGFLKKGTADWSNHNEAPVGQIDIIGSLKGDYGQLPKGKKGNENYGDGSKGAFVSQALMHNAKGFMDVQTLWDAYAPAIAVWIFKKTPPGRKVNGFLTKITGRMVGL